MIVIESDDEVHCVGNFKVFCIYLTKDFVLSKQLYAGMYLSEVQFYPVLILHALTLNTLKSGANMPSFKVIY